MTNRRRNPIPILLLAVVLAACGGHANLQRHAHAQAAALLFTVATDGRAVVLEQLEDDVVKATAGVTDQAEWVRLAEAVRDRYEREGGPIYLWNAASRLGLAYVRAVSTLDEDRPAWSKVIPLLSDALAVYTELRRVVGGDRLPAVPAAVAGLVSP